MFVVDTNVLVYAADSRCAEHRACRTLLARWRAQDLPWYLTWPIVYEFMRVSTHPRVFRHPLSSDAAWSFVQAVLVSPTLRVLRQTPHHERAATLILSEVPGLRGNIMHDVHTAVLMREHGVRHIYTRDTDFHRFPFLEVLDPLTA